MTGEKHDSGVDRLARGIARWLIERSQRSRRSRLMTMAAASLLITLPSLALLVATVVVHRGEATGWFSALGYAGIFLANFLSTATVFFPVPGLLAVGHGLIITGARVFDPFTVGLVGGIGMGLGESTAYLAGLVGAETARQLQPQVPRWLKPALDRLTRGINWLMSRYWLPTLFVLSVIPDPIFEFAGLAAGATRTGFGRFMAVVLAGNAIRGLIVAYLGAEIFSVV